MFELRFQREAFSEIYAMSSSGREESFEEMSGKLFSSHKFLSEKISEGFNK